VHVEFAHFILPHIAFPSPIDAPKIFFDMCAVFLMGLGKQGGGALGGERIAPCTTNAPCFWSCLC